MMRSVSKAYRRSSDSGHTTDSFFMTVDLQGEVVNAVNYEVSIPCLGELVLLSWHWLSRQ